MVENEPKRERIVEVLQFINLNLAAGILIGALAWGAQATADNQIAQKHQNNPAEVR